MTAALTERRKADRGTMARMVEDLCAEHGVKCERGRYEGPREIKLEIESGGICVGISFDGDNCTQLLDNYCLAWHMHYECDRRMSRRFGSSQCSDVNPFHRRKCTAFARGVDQLLKQIADAFKLIESGDAFEPEKAAA